MSCYLKYYQYTDICVSKFIDSCVVYYEIKVTVQNVEWTLERRYKDFDQLNEKLIEGNLISRKLLPPKKLVGNKNPDFLEQRRKLLEKYIQDLLVLFRDRMPKVLAEFLDFNKYDIIYLLQDLTTYFSKHENALLNVKEYSMSALELFAISECFSLQYPDDDERCKYDFSHVLEFCGQLEILKATPTKDTDVGCDYNLVDVPIGRSNIIPKKISFNLSAFKNLKTIQFFGLSSENIVDIDVLKPKIEHIKVHNTTITRINQVLVCNNIHKIDIGINTEPTWRNVVDLNLSGNLLTTIDTSIRTVPKLCTLILDQNRLNCIQNLNELPCLQKLSLCANSIVECIDWHLELGNLVTLNLAQNKIKKLSGLRKLYSLVNLDLSCNYINDLDEVDHISSLPMLESLKLTGNPLASSVDYRSRVLSRFNARACEISLDSEKGSGKELDTALVLSALHQSHIAKKQ